MAAAIQVIYCKDDANTNELTSSPASVDDESNFRKALLRALHELENEKEQPEAVEERGNGKIIQKAHSASLTFYSDTNEVATTKEYEITASSTTEPTFVTTPDTSQPEKEEYKDSNVVFQNSEGVVEHTVTSYEKEHRDIDGGNLEQILTSSSNSFLPPPKEEEQQFAKSIQDEKVSEPNTNTIENVQKSTSKPTTETTTVNTPSTTTDESQAKAEEVQFFSAPLVAAFTVHQDEQGHPKKVEPIFKQPIVDGTQKHFNDENEKLKHNELLKQQEKIQKQLKFEQIRIEEEQKQQLNQEELRRQREKALEQVQLQQKQRALEQEIFRLNFNLQQQQEFLIKQQEQLRFRNNAQPFLPIPNPGNNQVSNIPNKNIQPLSTIQRPVIQPLPTGQQVPLVQQPNVPQNALSIQGLPVKPGQVFNNGFDSVQNAVSLQPSITFDPLVENGKLPVNGQILPIKPAINFHTPLIQTSQFQQFHSLSPVVSNFNQLHNNVHALSQQQNTRFLRQENSVGNFVNKNTESFSIQQSIQPPPVQNNLIRSPSFSNELTAFRTFFPQQSNRYFRSNTEGTFQAPQSNRFFRSNAEGTFGAPTNFYRQGNDHQLNNLLFSSGAFRGRSNEDLNLVSKVLSLNHDNRYAASTINQRRIPYYRNA